jgi:hypothetical protein
MERPHYFEGGNMNKTKSLLSAIAFTGAMLGASTGYAASHAPATITLNDGAAYFGATFGANSMGAFADKFSFTVSKLSSLAGLVSSISQSASDGVNITGFDLFNSGGLSFGGTQLHSGMVDLWTVASAHLVPDTYYFLVSGNVLSNAAVSYSGNISVAAVPEPETYAMLLAGMGVVGFLARRRKGAVSVV